MNVQYYKFWIKYKYAIKFFNNKVTSLTISFMVMLLRLKKILTLNNIQNVTNLHETLFRTLRNQFLEHF
jgi:hypothetical protein